MPVLLILFIVLAGCCGNEKCEENEDNSASEDYCPGDCGIPLTCVDTDGGVNFYLKGTAGDEYGGEATDTCYDRNLGPVFECSDANCGLKEAVCWADDKVKSKTFYSECALGCIDGECILGGGEEEPCRLDGGCNEGLECCPVSEHGICKTNCSDYEISNIVFEQFSDNSGFLDWDSPLALQGEPEAEVPEIESYTVCYATGSTMPAASCENEDTSKTYSADDTGPLLINNLAPEHYNFRVVPNYQGASSPMLGTLSTGNQVSIATAAAACAMCNSVCLGDLTEILNAVKEAGCMIDVVWSDHKSADYLEAKNLMNSMRTTLRDMKNAVQNSPASQSCQIARSYLAQLQTQIGAFNDKFNSLVTNGPRPPCYAAPDWYTSVQARMDRVAAHLTQARSALSGMITNLRCCANSTTGAGAGAAATGGCIVGGSTIGGALCWGSAITVLVGELAILGWMGVEYHDIKTLENASLGWAEAEALFMDEVADLQAEGYVVDQFCKDGAVMVKYVNGDPSLGIEAIQPIKCDHARAEYLPSLDCMMDFYKKMEDNESCKASNPPFEGPLPQPSEYCNDACYAMSLQEYIEWGILGFCPGAKNAEGEELTEDDISNCMHGATCEGLYTWNDDLGLEWLIWKPYKLSDYSEWSTCPNAECNCINTEPTQAGSLVAVNVETGWCSDPPVFLDCCPYE